MTVPVLPLSPTVRKRLAGQPLLLLLDVDGTLAPIAERPEYAVVPPPTQRVLSAFTALPHTHVALLSGRGARDARRLVGVANVWVIGNHGIEVARPDQAPEVRPDIAGYADEISVALERCQAIAEAAPGVIVEDKRWTLSVHYRLADPAIVPAVSAHVADVANQLGLRLTVGKEVLELRPPVDVNKGTASVALAKTLGALDASASVLCAGDDRTDEDAFRVLRETRPSTVTVHVAGERDSRETAAEFSVANTDEMRTLLEELLEERSHFAR